MPSIQQHCLERFARRHSELRQRIALARALIKQLKETPEEPLPEDPGASVMAAVAWGADGINRNHLHQAPVVLPPPPAQQAFDYLLASGRAMQEANAAENVTLSALRDLLLPKLMSGEIRVKDAEVAVNRRLSQPAVAE